MIDFINEQKYSSVKARKTIAQIGGVSLRFVEPYCDLTKEEIKGLLTEIGKHYAFRVEHEVNTGFSIVDTVWFDQRLEPLWLERKKHLEKSLALPIVGFEIEEKTFARKNIRGDIDSLNSLSPHVGILVFSSKIRTYTLYNQELKKCNDSTEAMERADYHWGVAMNTFSKFAAASPQCRIVLWEDTDLLAVAQRLGISWSKNKQD